MDFRQLNNKIKQQFNQMQQHKLFRLNLSGQEIWDKYITGFSPEDDPIFRDPTSSEHNCNNDRNFIRRYGNIVAINDNHEIVSMFDIDVTNTRYADTIHGLQAYVRTGIVSEVFFETFDELNSLPYESCKKTNEVFRLGMEKTLKRYTIEECQKYGRVNCDDIYTFDHFHVDLNSSFVDKTGKSVERVMADHRDNKNVFERAMKEIPLDTLELVRDLIVQGSLLNGDAHLFKLEQFIPLKQEYDALSGNQKSNWCWVKSYNLPIAKFRNELIGTLCVELAEGVELNTACQTWNKRVDPANYMKASAPITGKQIAEAEKFITENDYVDSFDRRFATFEDIDVSEIRHMNVDNNKTKPVGLFGDVKASVSTRHKRSQFEGIEEVTIDKFMEQILPTCTSIEAFVENRLEDHMVVLTTANVKDSKPIFKWSNNYSWTYNGNLTGRSMIKENVKAVGGKTTGVLRCSLQWNDDETKGIVDLDLHCLTPRGHVYYSNKNDRETTTWLDVDMINPTKIGIENMTINEFKVDGVYNFYVRNFSGHKNFNGCKMEIEIDGTTYNYFVDKAFTGDVKIATITVKGGVVSNIEHHLPESSTDRVIWNVQTGEFHKVNLVCLSPNHWGDNNIGNKHYLFMLEGCKSDKPMRSFHNENLIGELNTHRKVMEVLATKRMLIPTNKQLAGIGFNATVNDDLIVKLGGSHKRTIKIKF